MGKHLLCFAFNAHRIRAIQNASKMKFESRQLDQLVISGHCSISFNETTKCHCRQQMSDFISKALCLYIPPDYIHTIP